MLKWSTFSEGLEQVTIYIYHFFADIMAELLQSQYEDVIHASFSIM